MIELHGFIINALPPNIRDMNEIIEDPLNIQPSWLVGILRDSGFLDHEVILDLEIQPIDDAIGFLSRIVRILPRCSENNQSLPLPKLLMMSGWHRLHVFLSPSKRLMSIVGQTSRMREKPNWQNATSFDT